MNGEILSLETAKKLNDQEEEIKKLKKREKECIDHYLVASKYASEMETKVIELNNIIKEVRELINYYGITPEQNDDIICRSILKRFLEILDKVKEI